MHGLMKCPGGEKVFYLKICSIVENQPPDHYGCKANQKTTVNCKRDIPHKKTGGCHATPADDPTAFPDLVFCHVTRDDRRYGTNHRQNLKNAGNAANHAEDRQGASAIAQQGGRFFRGGVE